jgi:hypothetical protein
MDFSAALSAEENMMNNPAVKIDEIKPTLQRPTNTAISTS